MSQDAFRPDPGASVDIAVTTSAASTPIPSGSGNQVRIYNSGAGAARFQFSNAVTATNGVLMAAGEIEVFTFDPNGNQGSPYISCIGAAATTFNVTRGNGS